MTTNDYDTNDTDDYELDEEFDQVIENFKIDPLNLFEKHQPIEAAYKNIDPNQLSNILEEFKHLSPDKMQKIMGQMTQQFGVDRTAVYDSLRTVGGNNYMTTADRLRQKIELRRKQSIENEKKTESCQSIPSDIPHTKKKRKKNKKKTPLSVNSL